MRGKIVLAVYSDTMEFGELGTDIDTKLSLIHTTIDKKYPLCSRSITTNSWKYEIPFVGGSDFIVKVLELSKIMTTIYGSNLTSTRQ